MDEELKSCPSCGGKAEYIKDYGMEGIASAVCCTECFMAAITLDQTSYKTSKETLTANWNKRIQS